MTPTEARSKGIDSTGRVYARIKDIKEGTVVQVDGDFGCILPWTIHKVENKGSGLFIPCSNGSHHLSCQIQDDYYIGLYKVELPQ